MFLVGDCFDHMAALPSGSVDMVLADLPYGTTQNKWDSVLDLERLWSEYWRLCRGAVVLDNTAGSGTTAIAAMRCGRDWICIERDPEYAAKAQARIADWLVS